MNQQTRYPLGKLNESIFRAYDIRGIVDDTLTDGVVYAIGRAFAAQSSAQNIDQVVVGADGRLSSPHYKNILTEALLDSGLNVLDVGFVATPTLYYASSQVPTHTSIMITGSHNPVNYNGFKMMLAGETLANEDIQQLKQRILANNYVTPSHQGELTHTDYRSAYCDYICQDINLQRPMKVIVDCGNGIPGDIAPALFRTLGCHVTDLYCEVDGHFPNHHPDPSKPKNLVDAIAAVQAHNADLGLAFDGDGDRVGIITPQGQLVDTDRLMMLLSEDLLSRHPQAEILYDVKCTRLLPQLIESLGGKATMWKTGHSLMKRKMRASDALIAGEVSGHIYFKERWFGFDDGLYAAARILEILSQHTQTADELFDAYPRDISTPELNITVGEEEKFAIIEKLKEQDFGAGKVQTIDGIRVDYSDGWGLVRASNTTPVLVLRFEGTSQEALDRIKNNFEQRLQQINQHLRIPND